MVKTVLKIDGMMCGMCEAHINDVMIPGDGGSGSFRRRHVAKHFNSGIIRIQKGATAIDG